MLPKSVSPRFVPLAAAILAILLCIPFIRLHNGPIKLIVLGENQGFLSLYFLTYVLSVAFLARKPSRISASACAAGPSSDSRRSIATKARWPSSCRSGSYRDLRLIQLISIILFFAGLVCLVLAWLLPSGGPPWDPWTKTITWLSFAIFLMIAGFLFSRIKPDLICELSEKGILAPDGFWGRQTFVPWGELAPLRDHPRRREAVRPLPPVGSVGTSSVQEEQGLDGPVDAIRTHADLPRPQVPVPAEGEARPGAGAGAGRGGVLRRLGSGARRLMHLGCASDGHRTELLRRLQPAGLHQEPIDIERHPRRDHQPQLRGPGRRPGVCRAAVRGSPAAGHRPPQRGRLPAGGRVPGGSRPRWSTTSPACW